MKIMMAIVGQKCKVCGNVLLLLFMEATFDNFSIKGQTCDIP